MRILLALALFITLFVPDPAQAEEQETLDIALIIGNNAHLDDSQWDLHFADDDAIETANHFELLYPNGQAWLLVSPDEETQKRNPGLQLGPENNPTLENWNNALKEIHSAIWERRSLRDVNVRLFLHFSGHGEKGGSLHLADSLLPPEAFRTGLARLNVDEVFALMDGCHLAQVIRSGSRTMEIQPPPIFAEDELLVKSRPDWLGLIGATTAVPEHDYLARGLLTMVGMSGLLGPADFDGDELITFFEWSRYISTQVDSGPNGPELFMVPPNRDWMSTVVDLRASGSPGIRLDPSFPKGQVRIIHGESRRLIADFLNLGDRTVSIRLPAGKYEVITLEERTSWRGGTYPGHRVPVTVDTGLVTLDGSVPSEAIVMVPDNLRGPLKTQGNVTQLSITPWEARALLNSPQGSDLPDISQGLHPLWSLNLDTYLPTLGPVLGVENESPLQPGFSFRIAHFWHAGSWGRWTFSAGPLVQYGLWNAGELYTGGEVETQEGLRHEHRFGIIADQSWTQGRLNVGFQPYAAYAPGYITGSDGLVKDESSGEAGAWRYVYTRNAVVGTAISLRTPFLDRWQMGPIIKVEALRFQLSPRAVTGAQSVVSWTAQATVGLELRRNLFSQL